MSKDESLRVLTERAHIREGTDKDLARLALEHGRILKLVQGEKGKEFKVGYDSSQTKTTPLTIEVEEYTLLQDAYGSLVENGNTGAKGRIDAEDYRLIN